MPYKVHTYPKNDQFEVQDAETILEAGLRHGHSLPHSCRSGNCGLCKATLLSGEVQYTNDVIPQLTKCAKNEILLCQTHPISDLSINIRQQNRNNDIEIKTYPCRIERMQKLSSDVMQLFLKLPDNENFKFLAGQYIDFLLPDGRRRSYSLANPPSSETNALLELHIRYVEGGYFTPQVFNKIKEKDVFRIEGPFGKFTINQQSDWPMIFIAGGTGFAPIKGMIEQCLQNSVQRSIHLYWGVRAKQDLYMDDLVRSWVERYDIFAYTPVLSEPLPSDQWEGRTGFVHRAVLEDRNDFSGYEVYSSGPPVMVNAALHSFTTEGQGLLESQFFSDPFNYAKDHVNVGNDS